MAQSGRTFKFFCKIIVILSNMYKQAAECFHHVALMWDILSAIRVLPD